MRLIWVVIPLMFSISFFTLLIPLTNTNSAYGLDCRPITFEEYFKKTPLIFSGRVIYVEHSIEYSSERTESSIVTFQVLEIFKGNNTNYVSVLTNVHDTWGGIQYQEDSKYNVYAHVFNNGLAADSLCGFTAESNVKNTKMVREMAENLGYVPFKSIAYDSESFAEEPKIIEIVYPIEQYIDSDLIVKGFIIDKKDWNGTTNIYDIKVEQYLKNSHDDDIISILAKATKTDASFFSKVKDDVLLHLKTTDRKDLRNRDLFSISFHDSLFDKNIEVNIPPLDQLRIIQKGYPLEKIACNSSLELIYKSTDNSSVCVKPHSVEQLISLGWAKQKIELPKTLIEIIPIQCGNAWEVYGANIYDHYPGTPEKYISAHVPVLNLEPKRIEGLIIQQYYEDKGAKIFERKFVPDATEPDLCEGCSCNAGGYGWHFLVSVDSLELFKGHNAWAELRYPQSGATLWNQEWTKIHDEPWNYPIYGEIDIGEVEIIQDYFKKFDITILDVKRSSENAQLCEALYCTAGTYHLLVSIEDYQKWTNLN